MTPSEESQPDRSLPAPHDALSGNGSSATVDATHSLEPTQHHPSQVAATENSPPTTFGDYEILAEIARGGMGVVYRARHKRLNRTVALKMILSGQFASPDQVKRFYTEAEAAAQLEHSGIVPIHEIGEHDGRHFFSMAYVDGQSLQARLKSGPLSPREASQIVKAIAEAVHFAHQKGIVHRDLKPQNILLDQLGAPKITDFGLAKRLDSAEGLTTTGDVLGTPNYMAPEQASGKIHELGPLVDVYALGAILYATLTGRPPFQAATLPETLRQVIEQEPAPPSLLNRATPHDLETICLKCLQKEPARRYASASSLADDVGRYLRGEAIHARPVSRLERSVRWCRRNPVVASLVSAIALFLVATSIISPIVALRMSELATDAKNKAESEAELKGKAQAAAKSEQEAKTAAIKKGEELRNYLSRQYVANGAQAIEEGDYSRALLWFIKALELDEEDQERQHDHRVRLGVTWRSMPRVTGFFLHDGPIRSARANGQQTRLVTASYDGTARIWNLLTGDPQGIVLQHGGYVYDAEFSPDGKLVATGSADGTARVWNAETGEAVTMPLEHGFSVREVAFSPDSQRLLTMCGTPNHWSPPPTGIDPHKDAPDRPDLPRGAIWEIASATATPLELPANAQGFAAVYSPSGDRVAVALAAKVLMFDAATGKLSASLEHSGTILDIQWSPDAGKLVAVRYDPNAAGGDWAHIWDMKTHQPVGAPLLVDDAVAFEDNDTLLLGGRLWDIASGKVIRTEIESMSSLASRLKRKKTAWYLVNKRDGVVLVDSADASWSIAAFHSKSAHRALVLEHGRKVAISTSDRCGICLWDVSGQAAIARPLLHPLGPAVSLAISPDGNRVATGDFSGGARVWDTASGKPVSPWLLHPVAGERAVVTTAASTRPWSSESPASQTVFVAFSPDGTLLATGGRDGKVQLWRTNDFQARGAPLVHTGYIANLVFPTPHTVLTAVRGERDGRAFVQAWDIDSGRPRWAPIDNHYRGHYLAVDPQGKRFAMGNASFEVRIGNLETGELLDKETKHSFFIQQMKFSPDGDVLVSTGGDGFARAWDTSSGRELQRWMHSGPVRATAISPDGRTVVTGGDYGSRFWDLSTGEATSPWLELKGSSVAFAPSGKYAAIGGSRVTRLLRIDTLETLGPAIRTTGLVNDIVFSPDSQQLGVSGNDCCANLADLSPLPLALSDLKLLAELQAGRRLNDAGQIEELSSETAQQRFAEARSRLPEFTSCSPELAQRWLKREASRLWEKELFDEALVLLNDPSVAGLMEDDLFCLRGLAATQTSDTTGAKADLTRAIDAGFDHPIVKSRLEGLGR